MGAVVRFTILGFIIKEKYMAVVSRLSADNKTLTIRVNGQFDVSCYQDFGASYKGQSSEGMEYVIDMSDTDYIDSSAMGMMVMLREYAGGDSADIKIANANSEIQQTLKEANFDQLFSLG